MIMKDELRRELLKGKYPAGTFLRQQELAESYNLSRTPAREVLKALESEGFLENIPHSGFRVVEVSLSGLLEILEMRALLEGYAARLLTGFGNPKIFAELQNISRELDARVNDYTETGHEPAFQAAADLDCLFHQRIVSECGNALLETLYHRVEIDQFHRSRRRYSLYRTSEAPTHGEILKAIRSGDGDSAERTARAHLNYQKELLLRNYPANKTGRRR